MADITLAVITRIPDAEKGESGNMALAIPYVVSEDPGPSNDYMGRVTSAAGMLGQAVLLIRAPVFRLGEILVMEGDRDALGRNPSKWDVDVEVYSDPEAAFQRSAEVQNP